MVVVEHFFPQKKEEMIRYLSPDVNLCGGHRPPLCDPAAHFDTGAVLSFTPVGVI